MTPVEINQDVLADSYSFQNEQANKRWVVTATASFFALNIDPTKTSQSFLGTEFSGDNLFPFVMVIVAITNIAYVVAHISAYKTATLFQEVCYEKEWTGIMISKRFTYVDYLYTKISSNYNRIWPIFEKIPNRVIREILFKPLKLLVDAVQIAIAPVAMIAMLGEIDYTNAVGLFSIAIAVFSVLASTYLWLRSALYVLEVRA